MFDPKTKIRLHDSTCKELGSIEPGDQFFDSDGKVRTVLEVVHSKGSVPRYRLETVDWRSIVTDGAQTWITHSFNPKNQFDGEGRITNRLYSTLDLPTKDRAESRVNLGRYLKTLDHPYSVPSDSRAEPELRAIAETMGQPEFMDVIGTWKGRVSALTPLERASEAYWYRFQPNFDYKPFTIDPEVFLAPVDYKERYLAAVYYLCGEYRTNSLAYIAHPNPEFIYDCRKLVWSLGGITPPPHRPLKILVQKSVNRLGYDYHYARIQSEGVNNYVPGDYFHTTKRFSLGLHSREELEPGPMVTLISDEPCHCVTEEYFPLYLPTW